MRKLLVFAQHALQTLAGEEDAALDRAQRQTHLFCYLAILVTGDVHGERHAVFLIEGADGLGNLLDGIRAFGRGQPRLLRYVEMIQVLGSVHYRSAARLATVVVDEDVAHDGEHPSLEVDVVNVFGLIVQNLERCVLYQILCGVSIGCQTAGEVEQISLQSYELIP